MSTEARVKEQVDAIQSSLKAGAESTLRTAELIAQVEDADESTVQDALKALMSAPTFSKYRTVGKNPRFDDDELRKRLPMSIDTLYDITRIEDEGVWQTLRDRIQPGITRKEVRVHIPRKKRNLPAWLVARISTSDEAIDPETRDELESWCSEHDLKISFTKRAGGNDAQQPEPERTKVQNWAAATPPSTPQAPSRTQAWFRVDFTNFLRGTGENADVSLIAS